MSRGQVRQTRVPPHAFSLRARTYKYGRNIAGLTNVVFLDRLECSLQHCEFVEIIPILATFESVLLGILKLIQT